MYPPEWPGVVDGDGIILELMEVDLEGYIYLRARPVDKPHPGFWDTYVPHSVTPLTPMATEMLRSATHGALVSAGCIVVME